MLLPCNAVQPLLQLSVLAVLPQAVRILTLELDSACPGPVLDVLERLTSLQDLFITGNGASITWGRRGTAEVLAKLVQLCLYFTLRLRVWHGGGALQPADTFAPARELPAC